MFYYKNFVFCIKCHSFYEPDKSVEVYKGEQISEKCSFIRNPNPKLKHYQNTMANITENY